MSITRRNFYPPLNEHGKGEIMDKIGEKVRKKRLKDVFCMLIFIFALLGVHSILAPKFLKNFRQIVVFWNTLYIFILPRKQITIFEQKMS